MPGLFLSPFLADGASGGGMVSRMHLGCLRLVSQDVTAFALTNRSPTDGYRTICSPRNKCVTATCNLMTLAGRLTPIGLFTVLREIRTRRPAWVFLDSSSLGWIALLTKVVSPTTRVITFFHNIEFDFQMDRSRLEGVQYRLAAAAEFVNERLTVGSSDTLIMLTKEDSMRARELYGRGADALMPVVLDDVVEAGRDFAEVSGSDRTVILFVGSNFYANREAVSFLVNKLAPRLEGHARKWTIVVVGNGFAKKDWVGKVPNNVQLLGRVDELDALYREAAVVVAPVFSGGGIKVKVAEALMHGRPVIGTPLALRGYLSDNVRRPHLRVASTVEEYMHAIDDITERCSELASAARRDFVERFSPSAGVRRMKDLLDVN